MRSRTLIVCLTSSLAVARVLLSTGCGSDSSGPGVQATEGGTVSFDAPTDAPAAFPLADTSFGVGGVARFTHAADWTDSRFSTSLLGPDDSIVVVSTTGKSEHTELARLTANGQVERAFAPSSTGVPTRGAFDVYSLTLDGDGKLVLVGANGDQSQAQRLLADGTKDAAFNAYVPIGDSFDSASLGGAVTESSGTVLACMSSRTTSARVIRFGSNGAAQQVNDAGTTATACPNLLLSDGSFLALVRGTVLATGGQTSKVVRLTRDLVLDANFGPPASDPTTFSSIQGLAALETRAFYAVGTRGVLGVTVARYTPAGVLDPSFAAAGIADLSKTLIGNTSVALQSDGKIVVSGSTSKEQRGVARVVRLLPSGALDASFGDAGVVDYDGGSDSDAPKVYVQKSGRIVALGTVRDASGVQDVVAFAFRSP